MSDLQQTSAIILAAGKGTRLNDGQPSALPKVMHEIAGKPMLWYTLGTLQQLDLKEVVVVVGYKAELIKDYFGDRVLYAEQTEQRGTGHAVACAQSKVSPDSENILVIQGDDSAFYKKETVENLVYSHVRDDAVVSLLTLQHPAPGELGRIIRDELGHITAIKEKEVLTEAERKIQEINTGTYCFRARWLWDNIGLLRPSATGKGELILPDLIHMAVEQGQIVSGHTITDPDEWIGVNTPEQLAHAQSVMAKRLAYS